MKLVMKVAVAPLYSSLVLDLHYHQEGLKVPQPA